MPSVDINDSRYLTVKRLLDTGLVLLSAPLTLPLGILTAVLVRVFMGSPVLFRQERIGLGENVFTLLKFRSMLPEVDSRGRALSAEQRITKFGKFLRKSSLDELPQLLNVLKGEMSIVGPRPLLVDYLPHYKESERSRHSVRPGITGAAQVQGRNNLGWDQRLAIDAEYAQTLSFAGDIRILKKTFADVFGGSGVETPGVGADLLSEHRSYPSEGGYRLRRFEIRDIPKRVEWFNHPDILSFMNFGGRVTVESTQQWLVNARRDPDRGDYTVSSIDSDEPVAVVGYRFYDESELPAVYVAVDPSRQGQGLGGTAVRLLMAHMRFGLDLPGAAAELYRSNAASEKLWINSGMTEVDASLPADRMRMEVVWHPED